MFADDILLNLAGAPANRSGEAVQVRTVPIAIINRIFVANIIARARALNLAVPQAIAALPAGSVDVRHQCGEKLRDEAAKAYADAGVAARVEAFITDMAEAYAWADLVVCRSGASTLAELCAVGVGSVLVPFAQAVDDHQTRNAEYLVERDAAVLLKQDEALAMTLAATLRDLAGDPARRLAMAEAAQQRGPTKFRG